MLKKEMSIENDGYWIYLMKNERPPYKITGKYLFFDEKKDKLIEIAKNEIEIHGFHIAKVNDSLIGNKTEHVLCLYYKDDSRRNELANRNKIEYGVKYRYWKSDDATRRGEYSQLFLSNLSENERKHFTK